MVITMAKEQEHHAETNTYNLLAIHNPLSGNYGILWANLNDSERVVLGMFRASEDRESSRTTRDAVARKCCRTIKRNKKVITSRYLKGKI